MCYNFRKGEKKMEESEKSLKQKKTKKILKAALFCFLALVLFAAGFVGGWFGRYYSFDPSLRSFLWAYSMAKEHYYRPLDETNFYEELYSSLSLDPYSRYFTTEGYSNYVSEGEGKSSGVGLSLTDEEVSGKTLPRVFLISENSPAERAGIRKGMYLFGFGKDEPNLSGNSEALVTFVGEQEKDFVLRCGYEADESDAKEYRLEKQAYQSAYAFYRDSETAFHISYDGSPEKSSPKPVLRETGEALSILDEKTGYLALTEFSGNAAEEVELLLEKMKERGRIHLILDLRTNGGGYLDTCTQISSHLLRNAEKGSSPVVVRAVYRGGGEKVYRAKRANFSLSQSDSRVLVLADENTASASECLIGALVDYGTISYQDIFLRKNAKGVAKTYGKGIMQTSYKGLFGGALKLTVAEIFWPLSHRSIHGVGVTPSDGANAVEADLIWGNHDPMLEAAAKSLSE